MEVRGGGGERSKRGVEKGEPERYYSPETNERI